MLVTRTSSYSGIERTIDIPCTPEQYFDWWTGNNIQRAMPQLTADQREFVLSGLTREEFAIVFPPDEDELDERLHLSSSNDRENIKDYLERNGDIGGIDLTPPEFLD